MQGEIMGGQTAAAQAPILASHYITSQKRWLLWKSVPDVEPKKKPRKIPYYINGIARGQTDTSQDLMQLATYEQVQGILKSNPSYAGIGFALGPDPNNSSMCWQGIDLDDVETNHLADLANSLPSYVEFSPSKKGCHAIGYGKPFHTLAPNSTGIEAYSKGKFFTFTGDVIRDAGLQDIEPFVREQLHPRHEAGEPAVSPWMGQTFVYLQPEVEAELRAALFSMRSDDYEHWVRMGMALRELGNKGRGIWLEWSSTSDKFNAQETAKKWEQLGTPQNTGHQAIFAEAQRRGWLNPKSNAARGIKKNGPGAALPSETTSEDGFALPTPELRPEALYGILGEIAAAGSAHTEAVPAALAINTLARFCAVIGAAPHIALGDDLRSLRPFVLIIGPTGFGRKGTSAQLPGRIFGTVEAYLASWNVPVLPLRHETAVSSGEGLVWMVRDPIPGKDGEMLDEGVPDKRVLLEISEFSGTLAQAKRESSTLTAVLRDAFDGRRLATPNKNNPCWATGAHFVTIGHITREELTALLTQTDVMNGFANRFMMVYSARIKRVHEPQPTPADGRQPVCPPDCHGSSLHHAARTTPHPAQRRSQAALDRYERRA